MKVSELHELREEDQWMLTAPLDRKAEAPRLLAGLKLGDIVFCIHCERYHRIGHFRKVESFELCPYEGCDGGLLEFWKGWPPGETEIVLGRRYDLQKMELEFNE